MVSRVRTAPVAINARAAIRAEIGGVERLTRELALRLPALRPDRYRVIRPSRRLAHRAGHLWEQALLPAQTLGADLILSPGNVAPAASRRNVVVLHDAAALRHPEAYSRAFVAYHRYILPLLARRARLVLTPSTFSRDELVEVLGADPARIVVVPEGVDERFSPDAEATSARRRHDLDRPYALVVGTVSDRKNLAALEPVAQALGERGIELVLAGSDRGYLRGEVPGVRRLGYVDEALLPGLYAGARVVVMPSRYEGFGLPCLEAMASGVPLVAARAGALPEVCGDAAVLVDPDRPGELAAATVTAATEDRLRAALRVAGIVRAGEFTWERTASVVDEAVGSLLARI
jgi:glycosyltransferase involved in cell wall biosynthesis